MTVLHLGSGLDYRAGAINIDRYDLTAADLQADALHLPFATGSVGNIEARHLVEHLGYAGTIYALAEWQRVLEPGGTILVETPDRQTTCQAVAQEGGPVQALHWLFGLPMVGHAHHTLFSDKDLPHVAEQAGLLPVEVERVDAPLPRLHLVAQNPGNHLADLRARLHNGFVAAGIIEPYSAPPHLAHLETVCDEIVSAVQALPRVGASGCLNRVLGATARYNPRLTEVAVEVLVDLALVSDKSAARIVALVHSLQQQAFPARQAAMLRQSPALPGTQRVRLERLAQQVNLYLVARLFPDEQALQAARQAFDADADPGTLTLSDREIDFFCQETVMALSRRETARGARSFAKGDLRAAGLSFERAIAYDADNLLPVWNLARLALASGQTIDALHHYAALLELVPQAGDALRIEMDQATGRTTSGSERFKGPIQGHSSLPSSLHGILLEPSEQRT